MSHTEKTIDSTRIFEGKVVRLRRDTVELENGKQTFREVIDHPGGVSILAMDENEKIFFVIHMHPFCFIVIYSTPPPIYFVNTFLKYFMSILILRSFISAIKKNRYEPYDSYRFIICLLSLPYPNVQYSVQTTSDRSNTEQR